MANPSASAKSRTPVDSRPEPCAPADGGGEPDATNGPKTDSTSGPSRAAASAKLLASEQEITQRLRAQYAEISQLAGGLAHEIRNPLSTLSLNLDLLLEDFQNPETPRDRRVLKRLERLRPEVQRLHGILESFLRFARVQELKLEPTDLNTVIDELRDFY
jgi:two-component system, NtrC family, sensor histidine kinase HydH